MTGDVEIEIVGEERSELNAQKSAFRQQGSVLFHQRCEVLQQSLTSYHTFAKQRSDFGATDVEHITKRRQLRQGDVGSITGQTITQTSSVNEQRDVGILANVVQTLQLGFRIDGSVFGWETNVKHPGSYHVFVGLVGIEVGYELLQLLSIDLPVV